MIMQNGNPHPGYYIQHGSLHDLAATSMFLNLWECISWLEDQITWSVYIYDYKILISVKQPT